jgi:SSS family solute:Na+ symporter
VANSGGVYEIPFLDRMGIVFALCILGMVIINLLQQKINPNVHVGKLIKVDKKWFVVEKDFFFGIILVIIALVILYAYFW